MKSLLLAVTLLSMSLCAGAATWKTDAVDGDWTNPNNWKDGGVPGAEDVAVFNVNSAQRAIVIPEDGVTVKGITFDTGSVGIYTFSGGPVSLADRGVIWNSKTADKAQTFTSDLVLLGDGIISNSFYTTGSTALMTFGAIQGSAMEGMTNTLTLAGTNSAGNIVGTISDGGNGGALKVVKEDKSTWVLTNNTFTGGVELHFGMLRLAHETALGTGVLTINGGILEKLKNSTIFTVSNEMVWDGNVEFIQPDAGNNVQFPIYFTGAIQVMRDLTVACGNGGGYYGRVFLSGDIAESGGARKITFANTTTYPCQLTLSGTNTWSGGTVINLTSSQGIVNFTHSKALGTGPIDFVYGRIGPTGSPAPIPEVPEVIISGTMVENGSTMVYDFGTLPISVPSNGVIAMSQGRLISAGTVTGLSETSSLKILKNGTSNATFADLKWNNTLKGGLTFEGGAGNSVIVNLYTPTAFGQGPVTFTNGEASPSVINNLSSAPFAIVTTNDYHVKTVFAFANTPTCTNLALMNGSMRLETNGVFRIGTVANTATRELKIGVPISDDETPRSLLKSGLGVLELAAENTYQGGTIVSAGVLRVTAEGALANGAVEIATGAQVEVPRGLRVYISSFTYDGVTYTEPGLFTESNFPGVVVGGGALCIDWPRRTLMSIY